MSREDEYRQTLFDEVFVAERGMLAFVVGPKGRIKRASQSWTTILGWSRDELLSAHYVDFVHPCDLSRSLERAKGLEEGPPLSVYSEFRNRYLCKDGSYIWVHWLLGVPVGDDEFLGVAVDITEWMSQQDLLEKRQRLLNHVEKLAQVGGWEFDAIRGEFDFSPAMMRIHGCLEGESWPTELNGMLNLFAPSARPTLRQAITDAVEHAQGWDVEVPLLESSEEEQQRWVRTLGNVETGDSGVVLMHGVVQDITERRLVQKELVEAKDRAEHAARTKAEFMATMSHEIRTPLNGVIGLTSLLAETRLSDEQVDYVDSIRSCSRALLAIVNDILDYSKIEAGKLELERIAFEPASILHEVADLFRPSLRSGVSLKRLLEGDFPRVLGDPGRIRQILTNFVSNAVKFTHTGSITVCLTSKVSENRLALRYAVGDTGEGIPKERLEAIFESFTQADVSTSRKHGGTGLGLTICRRLAELMDGTVDVKSVVGKGSEFGLSVVLELAEEWTNPALHFQPLATVSKALHHRILLVEDNPINQKVAGRMLEKLGCYIEVASNGKEAVEMVRTRSYTLVFMDCQMPVMDGFEATAEIRAISGPQSKIPIIALTANALEGDRERCVASGMDDYAIKPVSREVLAEMLARWSIELDVAANQ